MDLTGVFAQSKPCSFHDHADVKQKNKFGRRKNCEDNALCFYGLGEFKTGIWGQVGHMKLIQGLSQQHLAMGVVQRRDVHTQPAGFPNLGATCYMNSLVQTLFHNDRFRKLVYEYRPNPTSGSAEAKEHAYALQRLFTQLDLSTSESIDPSSFVELLKLETQIQQDAQEFNKLLLDHLSVVMETPELLEMFQGESKYTNTCMVCHSESGNTSPFLELELTLKNETDITGCLQTLFLPEQLIGENQYHCGVCECRVNAKRKLELTKLPPILNLQLLRFVFDPVSLAKRKTKESINIPEELELAPGIWYDLKAILFHKGQSANAGHYVSEILCRDGEWWIFNDHAVERRQLSKRASGTKNSSSGDAYMVIYHQRQSGVSEVDCRTLAPPELVQQVLEDNNRFETSRLFLMEQKRLVEEVGEVRKQQYQDVFLNQALPIDKQHLGERIWVPTQFLSNWITGEPQPTSGELFKGEPDYSIALCHHGKLDLAQARALMKLVPLAVWTVLGVSVLPPALCDECAKLASERDLGLRQEMDQLKRVEELLHFPVPTLESSDHAVWISREWLKQCRDNIKVRVYEIKELLSLPRKRSRLSSPSNGGGATEDDEGEGDGNGDERGGDGNGEYHLAKLNGNDKAGQDGRDVNADLVCPHGKLLPNTKPMRRLLLREHWDEVLQTYEHSKWLAKSTVLPEQSTMRCSECDQHKRQASDRMLVDRAVLRSVEHGPVLSALLARTTGFPHTARKLLLPVPRFFLDEFRAYLQGKTDQAPTDINLSALNCPHGRLVLNHRALQFLHDPKFKSLLVSPAAATTGEGGDGEDNSYGVEVEFVTMAEWAAIDCVMSHAASTQVLVPPITIKFASNQTLTECNPKLCAECCESLQRALEHGKYVYTNRQVLVHNLTPPSARLGKLQHPEVVALIVSSTDTLLQFKRKLWEACKRTARRSPPFDPHAFQVSRCGYVLDEDCDDTHLEALRVCAEDDLHYEYNPDHALLASSNTSNGGSAEGGFQGTALLASFTPSPVPGPLPRPPPPPPILTMGGDTAEQ
ncbi:hypothetical protein BASA81_013810 [Batrachochytrium salamandrivorans]|nr:hypothetical protein BASA81_013810 [Batrachochytrium salamandrivorans]